MENSTIDFVLLDVVLKELHELICISPKEEITPEVVSVYLFRHLPQQFYAHQVPLNSLAINPILNGYQVIINDTIKKDWTLN